VRGSRAGGILEYVIVTFPTDRIVYIDGEKNGQTNLVLELNAGTHTFDLGPFENYRPGSRKVVVEDTTMFEPRVVAFYRKEDE
jgi:hypothetical protein